MKTKIFLIFRCSFSYEWNSTLNKCSCPSGWLTSPSNQCYYKSTTKKNWDAAELDCISKNAHLISINSQAEADFLYSIRNFDSHTWVKIIFNYLFFYMKIIPILY